MRGRTVLSFATLGSLVPFSAGCALLFVHGPPDDHEELESFTCTENRFFPILDLALAGSSFLAAGEGGEQYPATPQSYAPAYSGYEVDNTGNILSAILFGVSGATGLGKVNACRRAKEELRERLAEAEASSSTPPPPTH